MSEERERDPSSPAPPPTGLDRLNGAEGTKCRGTGHRTCFQSDMWLGVVTGAESGLESEAHEKRFYGPGTSSQKLNSTDPRVWPRKQGGSGAELGRGTAGPNRLPRPLPGAELLPGPRRARGRVICLLGTHPPPTMGPPRGSQDGSVMKGGGRTHKIYFGPKEVRFKKEKVLFY